MQLPLPIILTGMDRERYATLPNPNTSGFCSLHATDPRRQLAQLALIITMLSAILPSELNETKALYEPSVNLCARKG
jgi:hypothetical protein